MLGPRGVVIVTSLRAVPPHSNILLHFSPSRACRRFSVGIKAAADDIEVEDGSYLTLAGEHSSLLEVKKSKFLAHAWPISCAEEALQGIAARSDRSASHNCWAFRADGGRLYRASDDGEPSGTAGRPILAAIESEGLDGACVLVTRWFGGVKLGAGGLVRAYGQAARGCLRAAPRARVTPRVELALEVPFELLGAVYGLLEQHGARKVAEDYGEATVALRLSLEQAAARRLGDAVCDATAGRVLPRPPPAPPAAAGEGR